MLLITELGEVGICARSSTASATTNDRALALEFIEKGASL